MFWDASALLPLVVEEKRSSGSRALLAKEDNLVVWWGTIVECESALARRVRGEVEPSVRESGALERLRVVLSMAVEVEPMAAVREEALRVLRRHALRAGDAFQLAAALDWCERCPRDARFVSLDRRLRDAAKREGFTVLPAELAS